MQRGGASLGSGRRALLPTLHLKPSQPGGGDDTWWISYDNRPKQSTRCGTFCCCHNQEATRRIKEAGQSDSEALDQLGYRRRQYRFAGYGGPRQPRHRHAEEGYRQALAGQKAPTAVRAQEFDFHGAS